MDDNAHIMLRFEKGAKGMLWASQVAVGCENTLTLRIYGEKAGLEWQQENPNQLSFTRFGQAKQLLTRGGAGFGETAGDWTRIPPGHPEGYLEGFANIYADFAKQISAFKDNKKPSEELLLVPTIEDGLKGVKFISSVVESGSSGGRWVKF